MMQNVDERLLKYMTKDERAKYAEAQRELEEAQKKAEEAKANLGSLSGLLEQREKEEQQFWSEVDERHENVFVYLAAKYPDLLEKELRYRQYRDRKDEEEHGESVSDTGPGVAEEDARADVSETSGEEYGSGGVSGDSISDDAEDINEEVTAAEDVEAEDTGPVSGEEPVEEIEDEEESDADLEDDELPDADFLDDDAEEPEPIDVRDEPEEIPEGEVSDEDTPAEPKADVIGQESIPVSIKAVNPDEPAKPHVNYDFDQNTVYVDGDKPSQTTEFDENSDGTEDIDDIEDIDDEPVEEADIPVDSDEESEPEEIEEDAVQEDETETEIETEPESSDDSESDEDEEYVIEDDADTSSDDLDIHEVTPAGDLVKPVKLLDGRDVEVKEKVEKGYSKLLIECASKINDYVQKSADELQNYKTEEDIDKFASESMETTSKIYDEALRSMGSYQMRHQFAVRPEMRRKWSDALYKVFDTSSDYMHEKVRERKNELK